MQVGTSVGPYRVVSHLGTGGMGSVWLAEDTRLHRRVALKTLRSERANPQSRERLLREARAVAALSHQHIAALFDVVEDNGEIVLVFEYVKGETLESLISRGPLPLAEVVRIGRQLAEALDAAHSHGVIHRDLKPSNVVLCDGHVKILDFGVARLVSVATASSGAIDTTMHGGFVGTPAYAAPEQMLSSDVDASADLYALGVVLYELASGRRPFNERDFISLANAKLIGQPHPLAALVPEVPRELDRLISSLLSTHAEARPESAAAVAQALTAFSNLLPRGRSPLLRLGTIVGASLAIILLTAVGMWGVLTRPATRSAVAPTVVAVLPFVNASGDASRDFVAAGLSDSLIASLATLPPIAVLSRATIADARTRVSQPAEIVRDLGATLFVEGTVQQSGNRIKVSVTLVRPDGKIVWAHTIENEYERIFDIQSGLANALSGALAVQLTPDQAERISRTPTASPAALAAYWRGRTLAEQFDVAGNLDAAITAYQEAIDLDRGFALAHAALGDAYRMQYQQKRDPALVKQAVAAATEALRLDSERPEVRFTLAVTLSLEGRLMEAEAELNRVLAVQPNYDDARRELGRVLARQGRIDEAVTEFNQAIALRPKSWSAYSVMGLALLGAQRYGAAAEAFRRVTELQPNNHIGYQQLGTAYQSLGRTQEALESYQKAIDIRPSAQAYSNIGALQHSRGEFALAVKAYQAAIDLRPNSAATHRNLGDALARLGQPVDAQKAYRQAVALARADLAVNPTDARVMAALAVYLQKSGDGAAAREYIGQALRRSERDNEVLFRAAMVHALSGRDTEAMDYLARAIKGGYSRSVAAEAEEFGALRSTARFKELTRPD